MQEQRPRIGKPGHVVGSGGVFGLLELQSVFDRQRHLGHDRQQDPQMIVGEGVAFGLVQRQHADRSVHSDQRHRQRAAHGGVPRFVIHVAGLHGRIAVDDGLAILRHPTRKSLPERNFERREQPQVLAVDVLGAQRFPAQHVDRDRVVGDHALQPDGQQRHGFVEAERISQVLSQFEQVEDFLARGGDGVEEVRRAARRSRRPSCGSSRTRRPAPARARSSGLWRAWPRSTHCACAMASHST